ncbi:MAG: WXG100 family type VII secretion target [Propionibacteriaceae bacterium]|nr:WXG100 family type VII secretion target [Propionibacteriaceae bacterium]
MAITHGMNVEQVRQIAGKLDREAQQIEAIIQHVNNHIQEALEAWKGPDSRQFSQLWEGQHRPQLRKLKNDLEDLARKARSNATAQTSTSSSF